MVDRFTNSITNYKMEEIMSHIKKVVLAYSGGLDTSVIIQWLMEKYGCEVIAFAANLGQGEELEATKKEGEGCRRQQDIHRGSEGEFVRDFVFPMLRAGAVYEGGYLLGTSIARPLISRKQIEIAKKEGPDAVCHGSTGKGNDQVRFELAYYALMPHIHVIAPWREWSMKSRSDLIAYAKKHRITVTATRKKPYSMDRNLFHMSFEEVFWRTRGWSPRSPSLHCRCHRKGPPTGPPTWR